MIIIVYLGRIPDALLDAKVISPLFFMNEDNITRFIEKAGVGSLAVGSDGITFNPTKIPLYSDEIMEYLNNNKVVQDAALLWVADINNTKDRIYQPY